MERFYFYTKYIRILSLTKFNYKNINDLTYLKKLNLKFDFKQTANLLSGLVALKLITNKTPFLEKEVLKSKKKFKPLIKGCYVSLDRSDLYYFLDKLVHLYLPKVQFFKGFEMKNLNKNNFYHQIEDISIFTELEDEFENFITLKNLKLNFYFSKSDLIQNKFLFQLLNIPTI
jgi:ribosomal protein L5